MRTNKSYGLPSSIKNVAKTGDVLDAFLTHVANEVSNLSKYIIQMSINLNSITNKKQKQEFEKDFLLKLEHFPPENSSFDVLIPTFTALASSNLDRAFISLDKYFPFVFSGSRSSEIGLLSFFPAIPQELDTIGYVVSCISNKIYAKLRCLMIPLM